MRSAKKGAFVLRAGFYSKIAATPRKNVRVLSMTELYWPGVLSRRMVKIALVPTEQ